MLLELHEKYTVSGLKAFSHLDEKIGIEILKGSFVNDLCELTNEYTKVNHSLNSYLEQKNNQAIKVSKTLLEYHPFYQSHWGKLSALHCMSNRYNEAPEITHKNILHWLYFLEFLIFNVDEQILNSKINTFKDILGDPVEELKFNISDLLDTDDIFEAKYRAMGMIIHMIEDSYTVSHCKREGDFIMQFYCYSEQSAFVHNQNDFVLAKHEENMLSDIHNVLTQLLAENSAKSYYQTIFNINESALPSSDGGFILKRKETYFFNIIKRFKQYILTFFSHFSFMKS